MKKTEQDVSLPHGVEQNIKTDLLGMIHSAENPFDIICRVAEYLEEASHEDGYAEQVKANLRSIYGVCLLDEKLLTDELHDVEERLKKIQDSYENGEFTEEERTRIRFAIDEHKRNIERLKLRIQLATVNKTSMMMKTHQGYLEE
ncbi:MAG: hypothetical protein IJT82_04415 [Schwartzia sp.]|nr:hypothetical protein [Schwartzia sp. (in: firmicutes)]